MAMSNGGGWPERSSHCKCVQRSWKPVHRATLARPGPTWKYHNGRLFWNFSVSHSSWQSLHIWFYSMLQPSVSVRLLIHGRRLTSLALIGITRWFLFLSDQPRALSLITKFSITMVNTQMAFEALLLFTMIMPLMPMTWTEKSSLLYPTGTTSKCQLYSILTSLGGTKKPPMGWSPSLTLLLSTTNRMKNFG